MQSTSHGPLNGESDCFEAVTDVGALKLLESDWDDLCLRSSGVRFSQNFAWRLTLWEEVEGPQAKWLHCIVARRRDRAVLIWPFIVYRKEHLVVASPLGCAQSEHPDPLVEDGPEAEARIETACKTLCDTCGCDLIEFQQVQEGSRLHRFLTGKAGKRAKRVVPREGAGTYELGVSALYRLGWRYPSLRPALSRYRLTSAGLKHARFHKREIARAKRDRQSRRADLHGDAAGYRAFGTLSAASWNAHAKLPTQLHCWARACLETVNARDEPWPLVSGQNLAPLIFKPGKTEDPHRLAFIGDPIAEIYDVMSDGDPVDDLAEAIAETGMPLHFKRVPEDAPIIAALKRAYRGRGFVTLKPWRWGGPYIELDDSWRDPESHFRSRERWVFRKRRRAAESLGPVAFEAIKPDTSNVDAVLKEAFAVEASGWKREAGSAMAVSPWRREFYSRYARYAAEEGILLVCFLRIGGKAAAMELAVECDNRFFGHKIGYDERFAICAPGNLLRLETLRYATERGLRSYEFQGKEERWIRDWTGSFRKTVSVMAHPVTARRFWGLT